MKIRPGQWVRHHYGVPAFIGRPVVFTWQSVRHPGTITSFVNGMMYLRIKFDDGFGDDQMFHPTWNMEYPPIDIGPRPEVPSEEQSPNLETSITP